MFVKLFGHFKALHKKHDLSVGVEGGADEMMPWRKQSLDWDDRKERERKQCGR